MRGLPRDRDAERAEGRSSNYACKGELFGEIGLGSSDAFNYLMMRRAEFV